VPKLAQTQEKVQLVARSQGSGTHGLKPGEKKTGIAAGEKPAEGKKTKTRQSEGILKVGGEGKQKC